MFSSYGAKYGIINDATCQWKIIVAGTLATEVVSQVIKEAAEAEHLAESDGGCQRTEVPADHVWG